MNIRENLIQYLMLKQQFNALEKTYKKLIRNLYEPNIENPSLESMQAYIDAEEEFNEFELKYLAIQNAMWQAHNSVAGIFMLHELVPEHKIEFLLNDGITKTWVKINEYDELEFDPTINFNKL